MEPDTPTIIPTTHSNDDDEESEPFDLGNVEMIDAVGDDTVVEKRTDSDVSHGQDMQNEASDKARFASFLTTTTNVVLDRLSILLPNILKALLKASKQWSSLLWRIGIAKF